jgi:hypothetical protein
MMGLSHAQSGAAAWLAVAWPIPVRGRMCACSGSSTRWRSPLAAWSAALALRGVVPRRRGRATVALFFPSLLLTPFGVPLVPRTYEELSCLTALC